MTIRNLFDDLKTVGKKHYFSRNDEEIVCFVSKELTIELSRCEKLVDLVITVCGKRNHYMASPLLSYDEKMEIRSALSALALTKPMAATITRILLTALARTK